MGSSLYCKEAKCKKFVRTMKLVVKWWKEKLRESRNDIRRYQKQ